MTPLDDRAFYAGLAPHYDTFYSNFATETEVAFIQWALGEHEPSSTTIVDVSTGTGRQAIPLLQLGYRVKMFDLSPDMLRLAETKAHALGLPCDSMLIDMCELESWEGVGELQADCVISILTAIAHIHDTDRLIAAFRGMRAALKPGGIAIIDTLNLMWLLDKFKPVIETHYPIEGGFVHRTNYHHLRPARSVMVHDEYIVEHRGETVRSYQFQTELRLQTAPELLHYLQMAGFPNPVLYYDATARTPATGDARRLLVVARRED